VPRSTLADGNPAPLTLGNAFNVPCVLIDRANHRYQVNDGAVVSVTPRVNGVDVSSTDNTSAGTFDLTGEPQGNLAADVATTLTTAATLIAWLAGEFDQTADGDTLSALPTWTLGMH